MSTIHVTGLNSKMKVMFGCVLNDCEAGVPATKNLHCAAARVRFTYI